MNKWALRLIACTVGLATVGALAGPRAYAAFFGTGSNSGDSFAAGTVVIGDNDSGSAMLAITNAKPTDAGATDTGCIKVTTTGTLDSTVRLYATVTGSLGPYLTLTVTRGTDAAPSFDSCSTFVADTTNYLGVGVGVIYSNKLSSFPTSYAAGLVDPTSSSPATWSTNTTHSYKFVISLDDNLAAQGLSATASFTWEARNS
jgi:hypothetical protein